MKSKAILFTREEGGKYVAFPARHSRDERVHTIFFADGSVWDLSIAAVMPERGGWRYQPSAKRAKQYAAVADRLRG